MEQLYGKGEVHENEDQRISGQILLCLNDDLRGPNLYGGLRFILVPK